MSYRFEDSFRAGASNSWNPQGVSSPVAGIALRLTHETEGWVRPIAGLDDLEKRKVSCPCRVTVLSVLSNCNFAVTRIFDFCVGKENVVLLIIIHLSTLTGNYFPGYFIHANSFTSILFLRAKVM
jgi:hypothetical protein